MAANRTGTKAWRALRARLIRTRALICHHCGVELDPHALPNTPLAIEVDHLVPVSKGGTDSESNCVLSCVRCNRSKNARDDYAPRARFAPEAWQDEDGNWRNSHGESIGARLW